VRKLTGLCTVTLAAVAFVAAPATAHETDAWSATTTPHGSTTDRGPCPPGPTETDDLGPGAGPAHDVISLSPAAVGDAGPAGSLSVSGNAAVLFVAGGGALAVTGSAVVARRRSTGTR
jgi:hypothetical protein